MPLLGKGAAKGTGNDMAWTPLSEAKLWDEINAAEARMSLPQRRLWRAMRIAPEKWKQHPYGDAGAGFWVVGIIGRIVLWFNDIEDGFNISNYREYGVIPEYFCNQDELEIAVQRLLAVVEAGKDIEGRLGPPMAIV
jgi:hypothetical protein